MRRARWLAVALLAAAPALQAQEREDRGGPQHRRIRYVDPSAVLATEIAFARLAQEKGQWAAFRKMADPEAVLFVPQRVAAEPWLKRRAEPPVAVRWQAQAVWASCDGLIAVTTGAWQQSGASGRYVTVWRRQDKGAYRWLLDMNIAGAAPAAPEMIPALVADCDGERLAPGSAEALQPGDDSETSVSRDGSLRWTSTVRADGSRRFALTMRQDGKPKDVLDLSGAGAP